MPDSPAPFRHASLSGAYQLQQDTLTELRRLLIAFLEGWSLSVRAFAEVELALSEATANVFEHAYGNRPGGTLEFAFAVDSERLRIRFLDDGVPFRNRRPVRKPNWQKLIQMEADGGFGRYAMVRTMDGIRYERAGGRNRLTMIKRLRRGR